MSLILLAILVFLVVAAVPMWPYNQDWGYVPAGGLGVALLAVIVLMIIGRLG